METQVKSDNGVMDIVKLYDLHESPSNPRKTFDEPALQELAESIKAVGILQPLVVRPQVEGFEIVCGHRRFRACKIAQHQNVPVIIRDDLSDEQALELQITENLQRKDVHPMEEAVAFERLKTERSYSLAEIAARVGKSEKFVVQRLQLNELIPEIQQPFYADVLNLTEAFKLARLKEIDQKKFFDNDLKNWQIEGFRIWNLDHRISHLMNRLEVAPFSLDDETLVKASGACNKCPKNTACNTLLWPDKADNAKCTDPACYDLKVEKYVEKVIEDFAEQGEEVILIYNGYSDLKLVDRYKRIGEYPLLKNWDDFETSKAKTAKKAIWINGEPGKIDTIQVKKRGSSNGVDESDPEFQIQKIYKRETRAKELDDEKVFEQVYKLIGDDSSWLKKGEDLNKVECTALAIAIIQSLGYISGGNKLLSTLLERDDINIYRSGPEDFDTIWKNLDKSKLNQLLRQLIVSTISYAKGMRHSSSRGAKAIYELAKDYQPKSVESIESSQKEVRMKRQERLNKRVEKLEKEKSDKKPKPKSKAKKKQALKEA